MLSILPPLVARLFANSIATAAVKDEATANAGAAQYKYSIHVQCKRC